MCYRGKHEVISKSIRILEKKLGKYVGGRKNFMKKKKNWKNCKGNIKESTLKNL
jgi:hypothetical protein